MHSREVVYHGIYSPKDLKCAVKEHIYPPAVHCVVMYNSPPECSRGVKMNKIIIKGTKMDKISFPFKVYEVKSKRLSFAMFQAHSADQSKHFQLLLSPHWMRTT